MRSERARGCTSNLERRGEAGIAHGRQGAGVAGRLWSEAAIANKSPVRVFIFVGAPARFPREISGNANTAGQPLVLGLGSGIRTWSCGVRKHDTHASSPLTPSYLASRGDYQYSEGRHALELGGCVQCEPLGSKGRPRRRVLRKDLGVRLIERRIVAREVSDEDCACGRAVGAALAWCSSCGGGISTATAWQLEESGANSQSRMLSRVVPGPAAFRTSPIMAKAHAVSALMPPAHRVGLPSRTDVMLTPTVPAT